MDEQQAKSIFIAQYLYQEIGANSVTDGIPILSPDYFNDDSDRFIVLRTIDQLTDEEKIQIAKLIDGHISNDYTERQLLEVAYRVIHHFNTGKNFIYSIGEVLKVISYMLRLGILSPFTYINESNEVITLSPDAIISKGWAIVKQ